MTKVSYPKLRFVRWHDPAVGNQPPRRKARVYIPDTLVTSIDIDPDRVLLSAVGRLHDVAVIGRGNHGRLYVASNIADGGDLLWLLERAKQELFKCAEQLDEEGGRSG